MKEKPSSILKELDPLDLAPFIAARLTVKYTLHSKKRLTSRQITKHEIDFLVKEFIYAFSQMVVRGLIDYFSYKFLVIHDKYRLVVRFHFFIEDGDIKFILKIVTVMYNYNTEVKILHNVMDVSKGVLLHGKKEIYIGRSDNGTQETGQSDI